MCVLGISEMSTMQCNMGPWVPANIKSARITFFFTLTKYLHMSNENPDEIQMDPESRQNKFSHCYMIDVP